MKQITSLFLSQSYMDTWDDYRRSLVQKNFSHWDYVILTASNEQQAQNFRIQLNKRQVEGYLPFNTHFAVIPDSGGKRIGSGGATLQVIRYIAKHLGKNDLSGTRILVIHSGGDSKRVPQYSALGKLFSPIPRELPDGRGSTLFDELIIAMSSVPSRIREGMLVLSGDVLLLFNPLQIDYSGDEAAVISFKEHVEIGKNHGVFLNGKDGNVAKFLHKQSTEMLYSCGAVNEQHCVDIDTGAVIFSTKMLNALYELFLENGKFSEELYNTFVNDTVRLSFYGDFLYPLATESTLEGFYKEKPEGEFCEELYRARFAIWNKLRPYRMKLLRLAPSKFIHFGTTKEILELMSNDIKEYSYLGWKKQVKSSIKNDTAGYNSILSRNAKIGKKCYLESSYIHSNAQVGDNVLLSYLNIEKETIPSNVVLHGIKLNNGKFVVRIYGIEDNPKNTLEENGSFLGITLNEFMKINNISLSDLWDTESHMLWNANIYPACESIGEALIEALNIYDIIHGKGNVLKWKNAQRESLNSSFNKADFQALLEWEQHMQEFVCMDTLSRMIYEKKAISEIKEIFKFDKLSKLQSDWLTNRLKQINFSEQIRLYYYLGNVLKGEESNQVIGECFKCISDTILRYSLNNIEENKNCHIVSNVCTIQLPLRVNWGGGWSDTPPYCNENGGTVLNAAILLNNKKPVEVTLEKISEEKIILCSEDMNTYGEFYDIEELQKTGDPYDLFALQKAAIIISGIIPIKGGNLKEILQRLGGGFKMNSKVVGVPKGSGLGTSSILAAACVKALFEFMGIVYTDDDIYSRVLCMEQIMSTGGGWQDQVGGLTNGIKYITSNCGLEQKIRVQYIDIPNNAKKELDERFVIIYTGQRRLARNLLRDVIGRYIGNESESIHALNEIQRVAALMRFELERGHVDDFAQLLNMHWELSKKIDAGSSNTLIEQIFLSIEDLIDGRMICGAGGGGFLQVILKKGISKNDVHIRLKEVFQDNSVDIWNCKLIF